MKDPSKLNWERISNRTWSRYFVKPEIDNRPFPRTKKCAGCNCEFMQKRHDHLHCSEACRWKKCILDDRPAAQRARDRSKEWYQKNKQRHMSNVSHGKLAQSVASSLLRTLSRAMSSECTEESATSARLVRLSKSQPRHTTSRIITVASNTGADQNQCDSGC